MSKAEVVVELLNQEIVSTPLVMPASLREIKTLIFEFPETSMTSAKSLTLSKEDKNKAQLETGVSPILPLPDLVSAPKMLVPINLEKEEIIRQVIEQFLRVSNEIYHSPESCSEKGNVYLDPSLFVVRCF